MGKLRLGGHMQPVMRDTDLVDSLLWWLNESLNHLLLLHYTSGNPPWPHQSKSLPSRALGGAMMLDFASEHWAL